MPKPLAAHRIAESIRERFSVLPPLTFSANPNSLKLELKPYLQPFEIDLAMRELRSLLGTNSKIVEEFGCYRVNTEKTVRIFRDNLTYWQRVGKKLLEPTLQILLEFTQNGLINSQDKFTLHNARRLRYGPHDLHEYRGKFFPQLVRSLINISGIPKSGIILDPFCGSGTTTCESLVSERSALGADLNPLSVLISRVKSAIVLENPDTFYGIINKYLSNFSFKKVKIESHWNKHDRDYLCRWFDPDAISDIASILTEIEKVHKPLYRDFFRVCLSNIIRSMSWQKDIDLRVRKEVRPYERGSAIIKFKEEVYKQFDKILSYLYVKPSCKKDLVLEIKKGNAVNVGELFSQYREEVDLLITSPPYATALPYLDTDRLSLIVLGLLPRKAHKNVEMFMVGTREVSERQRLAAWNLYLQRKNELPESVIKLISRIARSNHDDDVGFRKRNLPALLGKYFLDMYDSMRSAKMLMKPESRAYYVVGNNSTTIDNEKIEIPTNSLLFEVGAIAGWKTEESIPMELLHSRDIFKENRGTCESILCFKL